MLRIGILLHYESLRMRSAEQVHKEAIGAGYAFRQLPEERQPGVDVHSFSEFRVHQSTVQIFFAWIMHGEQCRVFWIELSPVVEPALLHPTVKILGGDFVRLVQSRIVGLQESDCSGFVGDTRERFSRFVADNLCRIRRVVLPFPRKVTLVLHQQGSAIQDVVEQSLIRARQVVAQFIGPHADDDCAVLGKAAERQGGGIEQFHLTPTPLAHRDRLASAVIAQ